ncbi:MAG: cytochrome P450, partial [Frankiaceae bacterium]|nr:cytochrome P450 [Frankiaceae bacterium]
MGTARAALRNQVRWAILHRGVRTYGSLQTRRGDPLARFLFAPGARANPYPVFDDVRARGRLVETKLMHVTVDHALATGILRDSQTFGVAFSDVQGVPRFVSWAFQAPDPEIASPVDAPSLLAVDPPEHSRYRRLVTRPFTPKALQKVADRVEERAIELLDGLAGKRRVDIVDEYADQLPVAVIAEILGVPADMHAQFLAWGHAAAPVLDLGLSHKQYTAVNQALRGMNQWFDEHFANLRRKPGDDILSQLVNADPDERLTDLELRATALLLLGAGFETTVNLLGSSVAVLAPDEKSRARLAAEPDLWPQAVEELLRFESPVQLTGRVAWKDTEV